MKKTTRKPSVKNASTVDAVLKTALALHKGGKYRAAADEYRRVLQQYPGHAGAWSNLGTALRSMGKFDASLVCAQKALAIDPGKPPFLTNFGNILTDLDRKEEALAAHAQAYAQVRDDFLIHKNYANSLREFGQYEHALAHYEAALKLKPNDDYIKWDIAITYLHLGRYKEGWEAFETRWRIGEITERPQTGKKWRGEPLKGKTILIYGEQGFGDTILCSRYVPLLKKRGARVIFECKKPLHKLFSTIDGIDKIAEYGQAGEDFDYICPVMSLPGIFETHLGNIPPVPELLVPEAPPAGAKALLDAAGRKLKVGIVWSGSVTFKGNRKRAVGVERFIPLARVPGVQLYSLQKGECEQELYDAGADTLIWDLSAHLKDFTDTAAILNQMDLVIMTDSSVAHLAGSIGCPVWNLLNYKPYWLYLSHREDTPWYPSMRLFRQPEPGDWDSVFAKVSNELEKATLLKHANLWPKRGAHKPRVKAA